MASSNSTDTYLIEQTAITKERALLVGLYGQQTPRTKAEEYLEELALLTDTAGGTRTIQGNPEPGQAAYRHLCRKRKAGRAQSADQG